MITAICRGRQLFSRTGGLVGIGRANTLSANLCGEKSRYKQTVRPLLYVVVVLLYTDLI